jgi:hypothetical protein
MPKKLDLLREDIGRALAGGAMKKDWAEDAVLSVDACWREDVGKGRPEVEEALAHLPDLRPYFKAAPPAATADRVRLARETLRHLGAVGMVEFRTTSVSCDICPADQDAIAAALEARVTRVSPIKAAWG